MNIHEAITIALQAHWKAHDNKYPQRIALTPADHAELMRTIKLVRSTAGDMQEPDRHRFMGTPLEVEVAGPSMLVAVDGTTVALSSNS
ncbi:MAG: hypothetical protein V4505_25490 [Pseudomonadota bacterium]